MIVSMAAKRSSASACLTRTPSRAPRPVATMIEMGVASPRAQGHAMMRTETAATTAYASDGLGPNASHAQNATTAMAMTAGTK